MHSYGLPDDNMVLITGFTRLLSASEIEFELVIKGDQYIVQTESELPPDARAYYDQWWADREAPMPISLWGAL